MKGLNLFRKDTRSRITALALAAVMALSGIPSIPAQAEENNTTVVATVADPETLHRPIDIYGQNTLNGGKITVGKSVSTEGFKENLLDGVSTGGLAPADNNFLVTLSQSAQAVGLASKMPVPVDAAASRTFSACGRKRSTSGMRANFLIKSRCPRKRNLPQEAAPRTLRQYS